MPCWTRSIALGGACERRTSIAIVPSANRSSAGSAVRRNDGCPRASRGFAGVAGWLAEGGQQVLTQAALAIQSTDIFELINANDQSPTIGAQPFISAAGEGEEGGGVRWCGIARRQQLGKHLTYLNTHQCTELVVGLKDLQVLDGEDCHLHRLRKEAFQVPQQGALATHWWHARQARSRLTRMRHPHGQGRAGQTGGFYRVKWTP